MKSLSWACALALVASCQSTARVDNRRGLAAGASSSQSPQTTQPAAAPVLRTDNGAGSPALPVANAAGTGAGSSCPAPKDASDFFGSPRCCNTNALVCDDFEATAVGGAPNAMLWSVERNSANDDVVAVTDAKAARGAHSLHIKVPNGNGGRAVIVNKTAFGTPLTVVYGRAFIYFDANLPNNHVTYIAAGPGNQGNNEWIRYSTFGNGNLGGNDSGPDNSANSSTPLPTRTWACLEWQFDAPNQTANFWLDGKTVTTFNFRTQNIRWGQVFIGWEIYTHDGSQAAWDMYYDEVALDSKRIGCAN